MFKAHIIASLRRLMVEVQLFDIQALPDEHEVDVGELLHLE